MYTQSFNSGPADQALRDLEAKLGDLTEAMAEISEEMLETTNERFNQSIAPDGTSWAPKSQATLDAYERQGLSADPRPLFGPNTSGVPMRQTIFAQTGPDYLELGTNAIQAAVMQFGAEKGAFGTYTLTPTNEASIPWGSIPARPFLGFSDEDEANIVSLVEDYLDPDTV